MRRAIPIVTATAGALALLAGFHTTPSSPAAPPTSTPDTTTTSGGAGQPTTSVPASTTTTAAAATRTIDGPDVQTQFGDVQVRVTLQGARIVDITALRLPFDRERSQRLSDYAGPRLRAEVLQAQSAWIDIVSGASYTSDAYAQSLQGALDQQ